MKKTPPELLFPTRAGFRAWLCENAESGEGIWLIFSKTKALLSISAAEALEEALCFGWIDGQIRKLDEDRYRKYFTRRRAGSNWSAVNKKAVESLRERGMMTALGEKAIEDAIRAGTWAAPEPAPIGDEQIEGLAQRLAGLSPAHENFLAMPRSVRLTYTKRFLSFKSEAARERDFWRIVERLNQNLKPM
ncbi:MAG: hypothetical protein LBD02_00200 [Christensenellaceae bacterium]|nr:hypothetical protein [Christensenellaceae bacterium]